MTNLLDGSPVPIADEPICAMEDAFPLRNDDIVVGQLDEILVQLKAITFLLRRLETMEH